MGYLGELRANIRPLAAASIGLGTGFSVNSFTLSTLAPYMLRDLGWTRAQFAAATILGLLVMVFMPIVGRIADLIGTRRTAAVGVVCLPLAFIAISFMTGDFRQYLAIYAFQSIFCITTTSTVFSRVVAGRFTIARGLALAIFASTPAVVGAMASPLINAFAADWGWRAGFRLLALCCFAGGTISLLLIPADADQSAMTAHKPRRATRDYAAILSSRTFWILFVALLLCNMPQIIYLSQLNILLIDRGLSPAAAAGMLSTFALANVLGRFSCGLSLDRFPMHLVCAISMGLPAAGYFLLAGGASNLILLHLSVFIIGMAFGAEGDLMAFVTVRLFGVEIYGSVFGMLTGAIGAAAAIGSGILGFTLKTTGNFTLFLNISGWSVLIGGAMFLLIGTGRSTPARRGQEAMAGTV